MTLPQPADEDGVPEVTETELGMLFQIRDAQDAGESIDEIKNAFQIAIGLVEAKMQGRLN